MEIKPITEAKLSPREAAIKLGISMNRVYNLLWSGKLRADQAEGKWYIPESAVEERLKARAVGRPSLAKPQGYDPTSK